LIVSLWLITSLLTTGDLPPWDVLLGALLVIGMVALFWFPLGWLVIASLVLYGLLK
jgi:hypothetical protein